MGASLARGGMGASQLTIKPTKIQSSRTCVFIRKMKFCQTAEQLWIKGSDPFIHRFLEFVCIHAYSWNFLPIPRTFTLKEKSAAQ